MKTIISICGFPFRLSSYKAGISHGFPNDPKDDMDHFIHRVKVARVVDPGKVARSASFLFYGSNHDYMSEKDELDFKGLIDAFASFLDDARYGKLRFEDFCSELGYDEDSRRVEKIHKECAKAHAKVVKLMEGTIANLDDFMIDAANELSGMVCQH